MKTKTTDYRHIVFLQGDNAIEALSVYEEGGHLAALDFLLQYDLCPEACRHTDYSPAGETDDLICWDRWELVINERYGYIGLCELS